MAASAFAGAGRAASGILQPLNILVSSAYQNCVKNASLISVLSTRHFSHIQTPVVSSTSRLTTSERNLTHGQISVILNRVVPLFPSVLNLLVRSLTYISTQKGKRKTVFLRLHCGLWVRRRAGSKKKLWKNEFVFCNKTQSKLLR
uniref:Uncharacterized protein n=1 Tax=Aotus nancymaae TaxID=37293 RepID=A0A2K5E5G1_AOTNA